jgi:hypothetical protein
MQCTPFLLMRMVEEPIWLDEARAHLAEGAGPRCEVSDSVDAIDIVFSPRFAAGAVAYGKSCVVNASPAPRSELSI